MAVTHTKYDQLEKVLMGEVDVTADTLKLALVTSSYTPSASSHDEWADASGYETSGTGYTAGGAALANVSIDNNKIDADDTTWSTLTATFRYGVLYAVGTFDGLTNPLLAYILFDDTPADKVLTGEDFLVSWHTNGIFTY